MPFISMPYHGYFSDAGHVFIYLLSCNCYIFMLLYFFPALPISLCHRQAVVIVVLQIKFYLSIYYLRYLYLCLEALALRYL